MRKVIILFSMFALISSPVLAGFDSWSTETEKDPFSGGIRVTVDYSSSLRSGVVIFCDDAQSGIQVRMIPGFAYEPSLADVTPEIEFAIDGQRLLGQEGQTGSVGDNLAISETNLTGDNAKTFVSAFAQAKRQIAIKDGISDRPYLLTARHSKKAGEALVTCMESQKH
nr:hypothetical protein [uncultured Gellertiella sp.]